MNKLISLASILGLSLVGAGCTNGASTGSLQGTVMSCFDASSTGTLTCVDTPAGPETQAEDVDDDGKDDPFVCADRDSDDDGTPDFEDHDGGDDHGSDAGSGSGSGTAVDDDHGGGSGDSDHDGIDDDHDCGHHPGPGSGSGSV